MCKGGAETEGDIAQGDNIEAAKDVSMIPFPSAPVSDLCRRLLPQECTRCHGTLSSCLWWN
jgi:hypothetical protein